MKIGELGVWKECIRGEQTDSFKETVGMLTRILNVDVDGYNILEIKTFQGETILAPGHECYSWSCPTNPGCHCGACHP